MVLVIDDLKFVLLEEYPSTSRLTASRTVRETYDRWTKANEKAKVYILASLSKVLAKKHEAMVSGWEIMKSLREIFGQPATHSEGASVREHVLDMMVHFNMVEMNGVVMNEASQISLILETLLKSYLQFHSNAVMNEV
ncbi:uncharacterized protein LOC120084725 [Benincasa hispida]|uniref:uncharacterized protein LOC120084725 n=1 Tax=Benincasa hispida TaxID=102211 RepID=UPI001901043C|nr:uncharacterized protein LOC120084725 [Benincasa hispida]